jgi:hypothetical protein
MHAILTETLGEHAPSYATVKNWVASSNVIISPFFLVGLKTYQHNLEGKLRGDKLISVKSDTQSQQRLFTVTTKTN